MWKLVPTGPITLKILKKYFLGAQPNSWPLQESTGLKLVSRDWALRLNLRLGTSHGLRVASLAATVLEVETGQVLGVGFD